ncbi:MAG: class I SAM-dependent methyltransferase [Chloroflexi bacterium]|nr:class I SAM-dependent methyltransferase [Chloroflexota bacterium]
MEDITRQNKEKSIWEKMAASYDKNVLASFEEAYRLSIQKSIQAVSRKDRVLEIGCGTGLVTLGVAPHVKQIEGVDIAPQMIAIAQRKAAQQGVKNVQFQVYDGYALPYEDASFDAVLLFNILHIVKEPHTPLREARRLLKPGGSLITATDCYAEPVPLHIRVRLSLQRVLHWLGVIPFMRYYRKAHLHSLFEQNSFQIQQTAALQSIPRNEYVLACKD